MFGMVSTALAGSLLKIFKLVVKIACVTDPAPEQNGADQLESRKYIPILNPHNDTMVQERHIIFMRIRLQYNKKKMFQDKDPEAHFVI